MMRQCPFCGGPLLLHWGLHSVPALTSSLGCSVRLADTAASVRQRLRNWQSGSLHVFCSFRSMSWAHRKSSSLAV
ncbi:hypothetical protein F5Y11DRAFT_318136 [Daldinia sp. FL1419]|nr:hypothetical protein F5Y11DRAFT_318136 [Daldinia sp. FL1419]